MMADKPQDRSLSRRKLFQGLGAVAITAAVLPQCVQSDSSQSAAKEYKPTFFTQNEWTFIQAATARLIPHDELGHGALEAGVPEFIDRQMNSEYARGALWYMQAPFQPDAPSTLGYQLRLVPRDIYRLGIKAANQYVQQIHHKSFDQLSADLQDLMLKDFESGHAQFNDVPSKTFFSFLLQNTREGFFSDPVHGGNKGLVGWTLIGFPGARADFMDWVDRNEAYPLPPVSINGQRG
ncbi:gluconate 2-dehydrogenase subunit 3 family protein [Aquirhabdus parva]|uniref:Gluconate 2-dehydrogenase subunit 3 family protein n=1 Tax=Aquirhabdus parva TaxID=2283318 RepID=A0A345P5U1_9GAMM|nr:gluconate 2-dehydrogenase subunit 3 family protein [Aquirhabdus parva]AXI02650.1 gluconate 2-dehydrogenase subunit 3 family protein [Aquirhabdus parva]